MPSLVLSYDHDVRVVVDRISDGRSGIVVVERKGDGHPDTLADRLAERLSAEYSRFTRNRYGAVLHHNFDKLALLGGASDVVYGGGTVSRPVRVLLNGRVTAAFGEENIPVFDLAESVTRAFFAERLPALTPHLEIVDNLTSTASPGSVRAGPDSSDRDRWFAPRSLDDLRERRMLLANDTSLGTGWAPRDPTEDFAKILTDVFASANSAFRQDNPWCGSDVKVMIVGVGRRVDVTMCVPQCSPHVESRESYLRNIAIALDRCRELADEHLADREVSFQLNTRDRLATDELYLTVTGSSIESGDEGVVGRGNRVNGLITPLRPMNLEGANGKNPVYHVGKLYNVVALRIAEDLAELGAGYAEAHLVSASGRALERPWQIVLRVENPVAESVIDGVLDRHLRSIPRLTQELIDEKVQLS